MKIYNKTPAKIFSDMAWPYKIVVLVGTAFFVFAIAYLFHFLTTDTLVRQDKGPLNISGLEKGAGALDPSIAADDRRAVMAYTVLTPANPHATAETGIALAALPACKNWTQTGKPFAAIAEEIMGPNGVTPLAAGTWQTETPSLVYDHRDPGREWKLYAHRYFWSGREDLARLYGFIVHKYADKSLQKWSEEEWLFSPDADHPPVPYAALIKSRLNELAPALGDIYFYSRPSVIIQDNVLIMSLSAYVRNKTTADRIILLKSDDHGKKWVYAGTPLREKDLAGFDDYKTLGGASLLRHEGKVYLAVVGGNDKTGGLGTLIFPFDDLTTGRLATDSTTGSPTAIRQLPLQSVRPSKAGGGYTAYNAACGMGIVTSEFSGVTEKFQIFKTYQKPVPPQE